MAFCPRCGAPVTASMAFCTKCGETLTPGAAQDAPPAGPAPQAPPAYAPQAPPPAAWGAGPTPPGPAGSTREPWVVLVLTLVTFGLYSLYYWWRLSKEMDAYMGTPDRSHKLVKFGVILTLVGAVAAIFVFISLIGTIIALDSTQGASMSEESAIGAMLGMMGAFLLVGMLTLAGTVLLYIGKYRVWEALEGEERRRGTRDALSAGLMLALSIAAYFVPFVGIALPFVVLYMTQDHINRIWAAPPAQAFGSPS